MDFWLLRCALALILLAAGGFTVFLLRQEKKVYTWAWRSVLAGFCSLTLLLIGQSWRTGLAPVLTFKAGLIFLAWAVLAVYLVLHFKFRLMVLGAFLVPWAVVLLLVSLFVPAAEIKTGPAVQNLWLASHILTSLLGLGMFSVTFVLGVAYLLQERQIKHKRFGSLYQRLPSLDTLDTISRHALIYGFPLLTIGMVTGSVYAQTALGTYWQWDSKEVWTLIVWLFYAALLHERFAVGLRGRKAAWMAIIAFFILLFSFVVVNFWLSDYHRFESLVRTRLP